MFRIGVEGQYQLSPGESMNPWFGLGIGYEILSLSAEGDTGVGTTYSSALSFSGLEFANLQGGADFRLAPNIGVGPFLSFSLGQYSSCSSEVDGSDLDCEVEDSTMHEWIVLGARGTFDL